MSPGDETYGLAAGSSRAEIPAPRVPYEPADPKSYRPKIALIGCGGISVQHLRAYKAAGYTVAVVCDTTETRAREGRDAFYPDGQGSLFFDAATRQGEQDTAFVAGTLASAQSTGPDLNAQSLVFATAEGIARPALKGAWFPDGFQGTMGELLCSIEERREPTNSARGNIASLALCFAAIHSAATGEASVPGAVRKLPGSVT